MKRLRRVSLVQFYLHEAFDIEIEGSAAFLGPNGSGKSSTLDAIQIAMLGGNQQYARFNTQSVSSKNTRKLSGYCLGMLRNPDKDSEVVGRARDEARTYIVLVFEEDDGSDVLSAGICVEADIESDQHEVKGLFVLPGQNLRAADCIIIDGDDRRPMPMPEFKENARQRSKQIGRSITFTDKSSEYVSELLYALNGERMPDPRRFMSRFVKSMTLKNVDSIDQFVRDYVVEPNPVDISQFRKQVEQFAALRNLIIQTKARISRLSGINSEFERARSTERRIVTLQAIRSVFEYEYLCEKIGDLEEQIELLTEQRDRASKFSLEAEKNRDTKQNEINVLKARLQSDDNEQLRLRLVELISSKLDLIQAYQQPGIDHANRLINALRDIIDEDDFAKERKTLSSVISTLVTARSDDNSGTAIESALQDTRQDIKSILCVAENLLGSTRKKQDDLIEQREAIHRTIRAAQKTGRLLNDGAIVLLDLLEQEGITAQPISALAGIIDSTWAPALESYLGGDRDALVITAGVPRDAVKILRQARREGIRIGGASIVQPYHLRNVDIEGKGAEFAVGVVATENDIARRFLWNKFGKMRLVETEEELETYSRAITRDGMLSQGGLTKSIGISPISDLRVGKKFEDTTDLSRNAAELEGDIKDLTKRVERLEALTRLTGSEAEADGESRASQLLDTQVIISSAQQQLENLDLSHLDEINSTVSDLEKQLKNFTHEFKKNHSLAAGLGQQIDDREKDKNEKDKKLPSVKEREQRATSHPLVNAEFLDQLKDEIERANDEYEEMLQDVRKKIEHNEPRLTNAILKATNELTRYIQDERLDVQVMAMEWQDRFHWTNEEMNKLIDTQLQNYEAQAEEARQASEETLRNDIAMSLNDRFNEMELERRDRNKILLSCPPFTGGERYRFVSSPVSHYESLVRYIAQIASDDQSLSLFTENPDEINETLRELVEAAAVTGNAGSVLDYRQFFTFDLEILVDGKRVDRMSNRQGAGSNGEHIAPMYVAAGAALAKAYRLHNRKGKQKSTGIMCLDEAFHGMDTTNAVATARFLQNLGLQLIMAGPELERTKLAPMTQTIYDLDREGVDLMMERTKFKEAANKLMVSDMPGDNPQVMVEAFQQLGFEPPETLESADQTA